MRQIRIFLWAFISIFLISCGGQKGEKNAQVAETKSIEPAKPEVWRITGELDGIVDGEITIGDEPFAANGRSIAVKDGKFTINGEEISEPRKFFLSIKEMRASMPIYIGGGLTEIEAFLERNG